MFIKHWSSAPDFLTLFLLEHNDWTSGYVHYDCNLNSLEANLIYSLINRLVTSYLAVTINKSYIL